MFKKLMDAIRNTGEQIQQARNEVGGPGYVAEREAAIVAMRDGKPLEAIAHKFQDVQAAGNHYEQESPLSRLRRMRDKLSNRTPER